jgi:lysyl-tRNA synthetase, class I
MKHEESMYWADQIARKVVEQFPKEKLYTVAAGITPSGTVHIGHFREIITTDIICRAIKSLGKKARFIYSWDDYDRIRKVPKNIPDPKGFEKYMFMPGVSAPDPWGCHKSYTEHFEKEAEEAIPLVGIKPQFIYQHKLYRSCKYAKDIKFILENRFQIRTILNKYRKEPLAENWYPVAIYCEKCQRDTTKVTDWDNDYTLKYSCECGYTGETNFKKTGNVGLPWRVDWPMRWRYERVSSEGGGKEHNTPGGSIDTGHDLCKNVFKYGPPVRFMYDFITVKGQTGKMASSKGDVVTLKENLEVYTPELTRYIFAGSKPQMEFKISFDEDIFKVYEDFYKCERIYFDKEKVTDRDKSHWSRVYEMSVVDKAPKKIPIQPAFKHCVELINLHQNAKQALESVPEKLTKIDKERYLAILICAENWLAKHAPEQYKFELQEKPISAGLSEKQKAALKDLAKALKKKYTDSKELASVFGEIAKKHDLGFKDFFGAVYQFLINKERGPRLAPFIIAVGQDKIRKILDKVK